MSLSTNLSRRQFFSRLAFGSAALMFGYSGMGRAAYKAHVAVVGGGFGGATVAKYLRLIDPAIAVTLYEKESRFVSCPGSNLVLSGERAIADISFGYEALGARYGIWVVHEEVSDIDPAGRAITTASGSRRNFDRIIVAPGIDFRWGDIDGYDETLASAMPHAYQSGDQVLALRKQLTAMEDGGLVVISVPPRPFRCTSAPYERASQIAYYLSEEKPASKVLILDANETFAMQALFEQGWAEYYPDLISRVSGSEDGRVVRLNPSTRTLYTEYGKHQGAVVNLIPPQQAGAIATRTGLADDSLWCPVDYRTFESTLAPGIHVIGDACRAGALPKSGYAANSEAKVCAAAVAALINGNQPAEPLFVNTCYSLITPEHGISAAMVYRLLDGDIQVVEDSGGDSPLDASESDRELEARYAISWLSSITADVFQ